MKRYRLLCFLLSMIIIVCLANKKTYSYFFSEEKSEKQTIMLGNLKIETNNTAENAWIYDPISVSGSSNINNDAINIIKLGGNLHAANLRPGDGFVKVIAITNSGTLNSSLDVKTGTITKSLPFKLAIAIKEHDANVVIKQDTSDSNKWHIDNFRPNAKIVFIIRLEVPVEITASGLNESNFTLNNDSLELLDISAEQYHSSSNNK